VDASSHRCPTWSLRSSSVAWFRVPWCVSMTHVLHSFFANKQVNSDAKYFAIFLAHNCPCDFRPLSSGVDGFIKCHSIKAEVAWHGMPYHEDSTRRKGPCRTSA
jgi:hypothetical protein